MGLSKLRTRLQILRSSSTAPYLKTFVPEGALSHFFRTDEVIDALGEEVINIPTHKRETTAGIICNEASKVFAILLELHWEQFLPRFIENDILDSRLPLDEATLKHLIPEAMKGFASLQYEYLAYRFRSGQYHKKLSEHQILPYVHSEYIGGGGFSSVYKVRVHSSHQNFINKSSPNVCCETLSRGHRRLTRQSGYRPDSEGAQAISSKRASRSRIAIPSWEPQAPKHCGTSSILYAVQYFEPTLSPSRHGFA